MSVLDLRVCPICRAESCLVRQKIKLQGERHVAYECLECGSLLLWLGDDLWMQADRWAYQKIGRADMEYLLQRSMTADELRALASHEAASGDGRRAASDGPAAPSWNRQPPAPVTRPVTGPVATAEKPQPAERPTNSSRAASAATQAAASAAADAQLTPGIPRDPEGPQSYAAVEPLQVPRQQGTWGYGAQPEPGYGPYQTWPEPQPFLQRRSRGSPFLMVSVALTLLCLICSSVAIIASTTFTGQAPLAILAPQSPSLGATSSLVLAATETPTAVASPVPTEQLLPAATEDPQPVPTGAAELQFQGVTEHKASTGTHYVVGEVLNKTASNLWFVQILATFYDGNGQVIGGGATFTELSILEAGSSAPFKLATLDPPSDLASYKLSFDYQTTAQSPLSVEIVEFSSFSDEAGGHHIVGDVRNNHEFAVKFPEVIATYYDASHNVIRVEMALSQLNTIQPGETAAFEVVLVDPPPELHHYALQTEALRQ